jgi:hypothetical protein
MVSKRFFYFESHFYETLVKPLPIVYPMDITTFPISLGGCFAINGIAHNPQFRFIWTIHKSHFSNQQFGSNFVLSSGSGKMFSNGNQIFNRQTHPHPAQK